MGSLALADLALWPKRGNDLCGATDSPTNFNPEYLDMIAKSCAGS
jgi:hypothetical protein